MGYADRSYSYSLGGGSGGGASGGFGGGLFGSVSPWVKRLLLANGAVWLLNAVGLLPRAWTIQTFGFSPGSVLTHPWSVVTYMFVHGGFLHVLVNMLFLFFFGPPLERKWGSREFLKFYLVAGAGGALISFLFLPLPMVAADTRVVGASGAVFGVMLAFALNWPEAKVWIWGLLPVRAKWFVGVLVLFTVYASFTSGGNVAHWAHLGGLATGFLYLRWGGGLSRRIDVVWDRVAGALGGDGGGASAGSGRSRRRRRADEASRGREIRFPGARKRKESSGDRPRADEDTLDEVDRILDKIREKGLDSLTDEEQEFLDEMSRRYRG